MIGHLSWAYRIPAPLGLGVPTKTRLESSVKTFKPHFIYDCRICDRALYTAHEYTPFGPAIFRVANNMSFLMRWFQFTGVLFIPISYTIAGVFGFDVDVLKLRKAGITLQTVTLDNISRTSEFEFDLPLLRELEISKASRELDVVATLPALPMLRKLVRCSRVPCPKLPCP